MAGVEWILASFRAYIEDLKCACQSSGNPRGSAGLGLYTAQVLVKASFCQRGTSGADLGQTSGVSGRGLLSTENDSVQGG
jgi:hypothetical protein